VPRNDTFAPYWRYWTTCMNECAYLGTGDAEHGKTRSIPPSLLKISVKSNSGTVQRSTNELERNRMIFNTNVLLSNSDRGESNFVWTQFEQLFLILSTINVYKLGSRFRTAFSSDDILKIGTIRIENREQRRVKPRLIMCTILIRLQSILFL